MCECGSRKEELTTIVPLRDRFRRSGRALRNVGFIGDNSENFSGFLREVTSPFNTPRKRGKVLAPQAGGTIFTTGRGTAITEFSSLKPLFGLLAPYHSRYTIAAPFGNDR